MPAAGRRTPLERLLPPLMPTDPVRPSVLFVLNSTIPYHQNLCRRAVAEVPGVDWHFGFSTPDGRWNLDLPDEGQFHFLFDPDEANALTSGSDNVHHTPLADLEAEVRRRGFDAVILAGYTTPAVRALAGAARRADVPFFIRADSNALADRRLSWPRRMAKQVRVRRRIRGRAGALAMGTLGRKYFRSYGVPDARIFNVPLTPDYHAFRSPPPDDVEAFRETNGLTADRRRLLVCSRLVPVKRVDQAIDAFRKVADKHEDVDLVIVGDGPLGERLMSSVDDAISNRVKWLGRRQMDEVVLAFAACDIFLLTSEYEPWGVVVLEAAAAGLPIVSSDVVAASRDVFGNGSGGRMYQTGDVNALADAIDEVLGDLPRFRERLAEDLRTFRDQFDPVDGLRRALSSAGIDVGPPGTRGSNDAVA